MIDNERPYFLLFNAMTDALAALEAQNFGLARTLLARAQEAGEELVIGQGEAEG